MRDSSRRYSYDETIKVIACADPNKEYSCIIPRRILCISPVLRGYIEEPDTTPPGLKRNGQGSFTLNNEGKVVDAVLNYLTQAYSVKRFVLRPNEVSAVFCVQLYKLALSLGLEDLCTTTLQCLRSQPRNRDDFVKAAAEVWQWNLVDGKEIRDWFTSCVNQQRDELLNLINGDDDLSKFGRVLISTLAHVGEDDKRRDSSAPPKLSSALPSPSSLKGKKTLGSNAKKGKFNASVEDAPESDEDS